jgi:hypothetical protein
MLRARQEAGEGGVKFHRFVMLVYYTGALLSTACRGSEPLHVRIDRQYDRARRRWQLRAVDRKNAKAHTVYLRERLLPDWLLDLYEGVSRPYLMVGQYEERCVAEAAQRHSFLIVNSEGRPFGCEEEDADGRGREHRRFRSRLNSMRDLWKETVGPIAADLGLTISLEHGEFDRHPIRAAAGHATYQKYGAQVAADLLGDDEEEIKRSYSQLDASRVDVSDLFGSYADLRPAAPTGAGGDAPSPAEFLAGPVSYSETLQHLVGSGLTGDDLAVTVDVLLRLHGLVGTSAPPLTPAELAYADALRGQVSAGLGGVGLVTTIGVLLRHCGLGAPGAPAASGGTKARHSLDAAA